MININTRNSKLQRGYAVFSFRVGSDSLPLATYNLKKLPLTHPSDLDMTGGKRVLFMEL